MNIAPIEAAQAMPRPRKRWTTPHILHAEIQETEKPYDPDESGNPGFGPS